MGVESVKKEELEFVNSSDAFGDETDERLHRLKRPLGR